MSTDENEIYERVRAIIAESLAMDEEDVVPDARLTDDLGAESIDYLDIFFQVERELGVRIDANERVVNDVLTDERYVHDGAITDVDMEELRRRLPDIDLTILEECRDVRRFLSVFTVEGIAEMVKTRLAKDAEVA